MYRLVPLGLKNEESPDDSPLHKSPDHFLEGELEECVIVSVPETSSRAYAADLRNRLEADLQRLVVVVTHNIAFLTAEKLAPLDAARVVKRIEDVQEERIRILGLDGKPAQ